jgi:hypothetical protein
MPVSFIVLAVFFVFTSFAFGCMENWSIATAEVILFLGAGISGYLNRDFWSFPKRLKAFALFVLVLIVVAVVQLIPLPVSFWNFADKDRIVAYEEGLQSEELLQSEKYRTDPFGKTVIPAEAERYTPKMPEWLTLSHAPMSTFKALVALFAGLCLILLIEDLAREGDSYLRRLAIIAGLSGLAVGMIALVGKSLEKKTHILGIRESERATNAFGPFVNGNHGEAFINLTFPLICYMIWRKSKDAKKTSDLWGMRLLTFAFVFLQGALVFSGTSRGNFLTVALVPVAGLMHLGLYGKKKTALVLGLFILLLLAGGGWFMVQDGLLSSHVRNQMNANVMDSLSFAGKGLNSFEETFPASVEKWYLGLPMRNEFLENEYLQLFYEGGILPFIGAVALCFYVIYQAAALLFVRGGRFWLLPPLVAESLRASFDMSFHVFPLVAVFLLIFTIAVRRRR